MLVYMFRAALLCEACGQQACVDTLAPIGRDSDNEYTWDSDDYPKGPYGDGGGEADCPQHCDVCGVFLENPLTQEGVDYVRGAVNDKPLNAVTREWLKHYGDDYDIVRREWWQSSSGCIDLQMTLEQAESASHQGRCDDDVEALSRELDIASQLAAVDPDVLRRELKEYGAWDATELADHDQNLQRLVWLAACDIKEESRHGTP